MAHHCYFDTPCPACGGFFVRYSEEALCPHCGSDAAPVYDLVDEVVHYARMDLTARGHLQLEAFQPLTPADRYVVHAYELLDAFRLHANLPPDAVADEAVRHYRLDPTEALADHWRGFFAAVLRRWQEERHRPVDPVTGASAPHPLLGPRPNIRREPDRRALGRGLTKGERAKDE